MRAERSDVAALRSHLFTHSMANEYQKYNGDALTPAAKGRGLKPKNGPANGIGNAAACAPVCAKTRFGNFGGKGHRKRGDKNRPNEAD